MWSEIRKAIEGSKQNEKSKKNIGNGVERLKVRDVLIMDHIFTFC
jgi:hypothetical protein